VILKFPGTVKFSGYQKIIESSLTYFRTLSCCNEFESSLLCMQTDFLQNGMYEEQGEHFQMGMEIIFKS